MPLIGGKRKFNASIALRVGKTSTINNMYDNNKITFACPANWIQYAYTTENDTIGDRLECVFAHTRVTDKRILGITDKMGKPMNDHLHIIDKGDGTCFLRLLPTILSPTLCMYSLDVFQEISNISKSGNNNTAALVMDLDEYIEEMNACLEDSSFLIITNVKRFIDELKIQVPIAVDQANNLTSERYYNSFNPEDPLIADLVDYKQIKDDNTIFYDYNKLRNEIFLKRSHYQGQSEMRIMLNNINFIQTYEYTRKYKYEQNQLNVFLPNLHEYALKYEAKQVKKLIFSDLDFKSRTYTLAVFGR